MAEVKSWTTVGSTGKHARRQRDRLVPAGFARHVEKALPDARSVVLEDCGHVPQYEHPERTNRLIREFIDA